MYYTLRFPDYATAKTAALSLGFWDDEVDQLRTDGQSQRPDGSWYGWAIDEIGTNPVDGAVGYFVNVVGELPPAALTYLAPGGYGCAGRLFAGSVAGPHV